MNPPPSVELVCGHYKMGTISRLTGFTPAALRAWERRHGLLKPVRTEGGHRFYTEEDLTVLRRIAALTAQGRPIGEIAAMGRAALLGPTTRPRPAGPGEPPPAPAPGEEAPEPLIQRILEAAERLDGEALSQCLDEAFALHPPPLAIRLVLEPAIRAIGQGWVEGRLSVAAEHLATVHFSRRLLRLLELTPPPPGARTLLCAGLPEEQHHLGALVVAYTLSRAGARVTYLGPSLPLDELERAARTAGAEAICLSVTRPALYQACRAELMTLGRRLSSSARIVLGGRGVPSSDPALEEAGLELWHDGRTLTELTASLLGP